MANLTGCARTVAVGASVDCAKNTPLDDVLTAWLHVENSFPTGVHIFRRVIDGVDGLLLDLPSRPFSKGKFTKQTLIMVGPYYFPADIWLPGTLFIP